MYDAYAWLTNEAGAGRPMRLVLIAAMAGFLVMALALPRSFGTMGLHSGSRIFLSSCSLWWLPHQGRKERGHAMLGVALHGPAALVIAAGLMHAGWNWLFFLAAVTLFAIATILLVNRVSRSTPRISSSDMGSSFSSSFGEDYRRHRPLVLLPARLTLGRCCHRPVAVLIAALWVELF